MIGTFLICKKARVNFLIFAAENLVQPATVQFIINFPA